MSSDPLISVIVIAFNRKEYLASVLDSLHKQTLNRSEFEVIVIKNFVDDITENLIKERGFLSISPDNPDSSAGDYLKAGLESSKGKIICLLDDDDLFLPEKLAKVKEVFTAFADVVYYHNAYLIIDSNGMEKPGNLRKMPSKPYKFNPSGRIRDRLISWYLMDFGPDTNNSSISFRKDIFEGRLYQLIGKNRLDILLYSFSLDSGRTMFIDPANLTKYRFHGSDSHFNGELSAVIQSEAQYLRRSVLEYSALLDYVSTKPALDYLNSICTLAKLNLSILGDRLPGYTGKNFHKLIRSFVFSRRKYFIATTIGYSISLFSPELSRQLYSRYKSQEVSRFS